MVQMTIISEIKKYISDNKLSDDDIKTKWLTVESSATKEQTVDSSNINVEEDSHEEDTEVEEDATEEQPDMRALIKEILTEELNSMKKGKKIPNAKKSVKKAPLKKQINREFGSL